MERGPVLQLLHQGSEIISNQMSYSPSQTLCASMTICLITFKVSKNERRLREQSVCEYYSHIQQMCKAVVARLSPKKLSNAAPTSRFVLTSNLRLHHIVKHLFSRARSFDSSVARNQFYASEPLALPRDQLQENDHTLHNPDTLALPLEHAIHYTLYLHHLPAASSQRIQPSSPLHPSTNPFRP